MTIEGGLAMTVWVRYDFEIITTFCKCTDTTRAPYLLESNENKNEIKVHTEQKRAMGEFNN